MIKSVLFYISGHGFGHATRQMEVVRQMLKQASESIRVIVKTTAPVERLCSADMDFELVRSETDVGVIQKDSITSDIPATLNSLKAFWGNSEKWVEDEIAFAKENNVGVIVSDISPLAFEVSGALGILGIGISNFSWDWIYSGYKNPLFDPYIRKIKESYAKCDLLLRLPFYGDLSAFRRICDIPCISRKSPFKQKQIKRQLGIEVDKKLVLFSFGGCGLDSFPVGKLYDLDKYCFVTTSEEPIRGKNLFCFSDSELLRRGVSFPDIVKAADAVVTKLGYGIVSECIANETPMLSVFREDFLESQAFLKTLGDYVPLLTFSHGELLSANWGPGLDKLFALDKKVKKMSLHGAEVASQLLIKALNGKLDINEESRLFNLVL